ncbi:MAG: hypothetical protein GY847_28545 [Proteobacteria bacterium]|nr:hypothetical protein [Pseudomonadota bacterium]
MNRGARREPIFPSDEACGMFLDLLSELPQRYGVIVHGYALMPNHYHLMLESKRGELSRAMAYFQGKYVAILNTIFDWDGPVFKGRFQNRVVYRDEYWMNLLIYLHLNPVKARLAVTPAQAQWTSHRYYARRTSPPTWLQTSELKEMLDAYGGYTTYLRDMLAGRSETPDDFDTVHFERSRSTSAETGEVPKTETRTITVKQAVREVMRASGASSDELKTSRYGSKGNPARIVAAYWLACESGLKHREVGLELNMSEVSVSKAVRKVRSPGNALNELGRLVSNLEEIKMKRG